MEWIKVFPERSELLKQLLENKPRLLIIGGVRICLVLRNEQVFAVEDYCPHSGESLSKGAVNFMGEIICPLHGYGFQLKTGRETSERCRDLKTWLTREDETGFYIGM